ncbi:MAG TPA: RidA family protein [Thermoanaerobaculia bacterium]|nr:RidA family protein [Thermoanaerobaculia bacterium]
MRQAVLIILVVLIAALLLFAGCTVAVDPKYHTLPERASLGLPYSDAVRVGNLLFLSGTVGQVPGTRQVVSGGVVAETRQALTNIKTNLEAHGSSLDRVAKCTVMLADISDFDAMNQVYREYFPRNTPARTTFGVAALPLGARVEIECIAVVNGR